LISIKIVAIVAHRIHLKMAVTGSMA
jgi:hypothetical protein